MLPKYNQFNGSKIPMVATIPWIMEINTITKVKILINLFFVVFVKWVISNGVSNNESHNH